MFEGATLAKGEELCVLAMTERPNTEALYSPNALKDQCLGFSAI